LRAGNLFRHHAETFEWNYLPAVLTAGFRTTLMGLEQSSLWAMSVLGVDQLFVPKKSRQRSHYRKSSALVAAIAGRLTQSLRNTLPVVKRKFFKSAVGKRPVNFTDR
jgi:hypothetical protein